MAEAMASPEESVGGKPAGTPVGRHGGRVDVDERRAWSMNGFLALLFALVLLAGALWLIIQGAVTSARTSEPTVVNFVVGALAILATGVVLSSLTIVAPGDTKVLQFFGRYLGTVRRTGLLLVTPLTTKRKVSVKVHNFETNELKVNDFDGNPINIAAIVVWQVADTAKAIFAVESYTGFVHVQS